MFIRIRRRWRFVQVGQFWNAFKSPFQKCFRFPRVLKNTLMLLLRDKLTKPWPFRRSFSTVSMKKVENFAAVWLSLINDYRRRLQILARAIRTRTKAQTLHRCTTQCAPSLAVSNSFSDHAPSLSISPIHLTFWSTRPAYSSLYVYICSANSQEPLSAYISLTHTHSPLFRCTSGANFFASQWTSRAIECTFVCKPISPFNKFVPTTNSSAALTSVR